MRSRLRREPIRAAVAECGQWWDRLEPVRDRVRLRFEIDARSLAALRIALGLILLIDLLHRAGSLELFYTDHGAYPVAAYEATYGQYTGLSIHAASGELWFQQLMFLVAGLFAVALILGYRTRLVGFVSLVLLFSLHARNPTILNGGDRLLRVLFLVALAAPLGERWSIDALRRGSARSSVVSAGTAALVIQPVVVFTANAIQKHNGNNWYAGDALEIALLNDVMTVYLGNALVDYPSLLTVFNYAWVTLLAGSILFLLLPAGRLRALAALVYAGAFAGMLATMAVGLFPLALIAAVIPFLTAPFWDALARRVPSSWADRPPTAARLGPLGSQPVERRLLRTLRERGHEFAASYAVAYARSLMTVFGVMVLVWILLFAASDVTGTDVPDEIDYPHLDQQRWGLYAPDPSESYSWYVVEAELEDGSRIDAFDGGSANFDRPPDASAEYETFRHRKFMQSIRDSGKSDTSDVIAESYADWACERASAEHDDRVERVTVYRMYQSSPVDGEYEDVRKLQVIKRDCRSSESPPRERLEPGSPIPIDGEERRRSTTPTIADR